MSREPIDMAGKDGALEAYFSAARAEQTLPSADLLARIEADALVARPGAQVGARARRSVLSGLMQAIGGWPAMAGLAAAVCTGVWLGFSPPAGVDALWTGEDAFSALDPISGYDFAMVEG